MLSRKRRIDKALTYTFGEEFSEILINKEKLPHKLGGPGRFFFFSLA